MRKENQKEGEAKRMREDKCKGDEIRVVEKKRRSKNK